MTPSERKKLMYDEWAQLQEKWCPRLDDWNIRVNPRLKVTAGKCKYPYRLIEIAGWHLHRSEASEIVNTIRHEAAHALAGPSARHSWAWKAWAVKVGARPEACYTEAVAANNMREPHRYEYYCPRCDRVVGKRRRRTRSRRVHRYCGTTVTLRPLSEVTNA